MDLDKKYIDSNGEEHTIMWMVINEPRWAATRIQEGEKAVEYVKDLEQSMNQLELTLSNFLEKIGYKLIPIKENNNE